MYPWTSEILPFISYNLRPLLHESMQLWRTRPAATSLPPAEHLQRREVSKGFVQVLEQRSVAVQREVKLHRQPGRAHWMSPAALSLIPQNSAQERRLKNHAEKETQSRGHLQVPSVRSLARNFLQLPWARFVPKVLKFYQERLSDLIGPYWGTYGIGDLGSFNLCW